MSRSDSIFVVVIAAGWIGVSGLVWGTHVAGGADAYGYVSQAALWADGDLTIEQPIRERLRWPDVDSTLAPLGYRPGQEPGTIVPIYAAGLPIVMAAFQRVAGPDAVFWVVPLLGMLAVVAVAGLATRLAGPTAGAFAGLLIASSPTVMFSAIWPMSDLAAAGWWALATLWVTRSGTASAAVAGGAAALAVMTRPNLVGMAVVPAVYLIYRTRHGEGRDGWIRLVIFSGCTAAGCLAVAMIHTTLYGSPFESGYGDLDWFFEAERGVENIFGFLMRPLVVEPVLVVLATVGATAGLRRDEAAETRAVTALCVGLVGVTLASYLFFYSFPEWWYLRILVPAYPALAVLGGVGMSRLAERTPRWRWPVLVAVAAVTVFVGLAQAVERDVYRQWEYESRYAEVGRYVSSELPANAVLLAFHHSGSLRYYADRLTVRFDVLPAEWLEKATEMLRTEGYAPYFVIEDTEADLFTERFASVTPLGAIDWPPRAQFEGSVRVRIFDPTDSPEPDNLASILTQDTVRVSEQPSGLPTIEITGPTVIAFWTSPTSNAELAADPDLAAALDQQQYYWAETRDRLSALGVTALGQPGQRFRVREDQTERLFSTPPDSAPVGYLLVEPGSEFRILYRLQYPDQLLDEVRRLFGLGPP